jgi:ABC-type siderophore export system fused ATPase/permease subunit
MDFQEKEKIYETLRSKIKRNKKTISNLKTSAKIIAIVFVSLLCIVFYMNNVAEIENVFTKISTYLLLLLFLFLASVNFLIKKKQHRLKIIDGKINVLINI